jgi:long-chain acyl-CoA synthetase
MGAIRGLWAAAGDDPGRLVLVDPSGGEWSAGQLLARSNQLVHLLRDRGMGAGDTVATISPNHVDIFVVLLAAFQAGWRYTAVNSNLAAPEMAYILEDTSAAVVVVHHANLAGRDAVVQADVPLPGRISLGVLDGFEALEEALVGQSVFAPRNRVAGEFLQYTSGTSGRPKGVIREVPAMDPETAVEASSVNIRRYDIEPGDGHVHLVTSPMYHMAPLFFGLFALHLEHKVVLMDTWDAEDALRLIEAHGVTTTHMVPTQFQRLARLPDEIKNSYDVSSLRVVLHAAAPCPIQLKQEMLAWWGPVLYEYYGATEGGGTVAPPDEWLTHPGTVGRPWEGGGVRILDDGGRDLPPGTVGTVYMKLIGDFEYKGDSAKTAANRVGDYFTVGDVGELDADGYLYLRDRKIDMIISGGVNIYPAEVEAALLEHPSVADAAVFGIPNDEWGEEVKAVVEPLVAMADSPGLIADIEAHCAERLAGYKCPKSIELAEALPRDPNGKLYKRRLREPYWADRDRSI